MCRTVTLASSGNIKVSVTTDPGADDFKVYLATNATCTGLTYCTHTGTGNSNVTISSCATGEPSPPDVQRPPLASTLPNTTPVAATPPRADVGDDGQCVDTSTSSDS